MEGGKETTGETASSVVCTFPMVPCGSSPVTRFALASAMRKKKRLRRRLSWDSKPDCMTFISFTSFRHLLGCISPCPVNTAEATCVNNEFFKSSFHLFSI